jgi:hypothetical protein
MDGFAGSASIVASSWRIDSRLTSGNGGSDGSSDQVSFVSLKSLAMEALDRRSMLRMLVLAEPDLLPREHALAKVQVFVRILYEELPRTS